MMKVGNSTGFLMRCTGWILSFVSGLAARLALLRLFDHQNMQVRLQAAKWSLGVAPKAARHVIEEIKKVIPIGFRKPARQA